MTRDIDSQPVRKKLIERNHTELLLAVKRVTSNEIYIYSICAQRVSHASDRCFLEVACQMDLQQTQMLADTFDVRAIGTTGAFSMFHAYNAAFLCGSVH